MIARAIFGNPWVILGIVLGLIGSHYYAYHKGYSIADQTAKVATLTQQIETLQEDARIAREAAQKYASQYLADQEFLNSADAEIERLKDELKDRSVVCLPADDAKRLQDYFRNTAPPDPGNPG